MQNNSKTASMPSYGAGAPTNGAQYRSSPGQFAPAAYSQFNMAGGPPPSQFNMAGGPPSQFNMAGGPPSGQYAPPPYASAPPYASGGLMAPQQMGMQQGMPQQQMGMQQGMPQQQMGSMPQQQMGSMPQQYGTQQAFGNPPLQQPFQQPFGAPAGGFVGSVSLAKGGNVSLTKANPNLAKVRVGLGWDVRQTGGPAFDLDASTFLLKADGRVRCPQDLVFYNNKQSTDGSVFHHGDNLTGVGEGDDEIISVDLMRVPMEIQKLVFTCSIYDAEQRQQNFGMVSRAFIRVVDDLTGQEICRYDLTEEASLLSTMIFGEVYRYGNEWKFRAVGQGIQGGLRAIGAMFGLNLQ